MKTYYAIVHDDGEVFTDLNKSLLIYIEKKIAINIAKNINNFPRNHGQPKVKVIKINIVTGC